MLGERAGRADVQKLADELTATIAFEEANKNRSGVVSAAQARFASVAKDSAGI